MSEKATERVHKLQAEGAVAEKEVAQSEGELRKARSDYARATAQLKALGVSPSDPAVNAALRAQIAGVVVERNVLVGQEVRADQATPLMTISSLDTVWVLADAYEQDLGAGRGGGHRDRSRCRPIRARSSPGKVGHIGDVVDPGHPHGQDPLRRPEQGPPAEARDVREGRRQRQRPPQGDRRSRPRRC